MSKKERIETVEAETDTLVEDGPYVRACRVYGVTPDAAVAPPTKLASVVHHGEEQDVAAPAEPSTSTSTHPAAKRVGPVVVTTFEDLIVLSSIFSEAIVGGSDSEQGTTGTTSSREALLQTMTLLLKIVRRFEKHPVSKSFVVDWEPLEWLPSILACLDQAGLQRSGVSCS